MPQSKCRLEFEVSVMMPHPEFRAVDNLQYSIVNVLVYLSGGGAGANLTFESGLVFYRFHLTAH
jgi:hypothetical protein